MQNTALNRGAITLCAFFLAVWLNAQDMSCFLIFWKDKVSLETHKESSLATLSIIDISPSFIGEVLITEKDL